MLLLILDKSNLDMSIAEALSVLKPKEYNLYDNYLIIEGFNIFNKINFKKLSFAFIKEIHEIISVADSLDDIKIKISSSNLSKLYKFDFKVKTKGFKFDTYSKLFGSLVWKNIDNSKIKPIVNLTNPKTIFFVLKSDSKYFFTKNVWVNTDNFKLRKNKELPERMPTSTSPKLAKAMINLTGLKNSKIIDPFCGSGGILIEGDLLGHKMTGYDIDKRAFGKAKLNLLHLGLNKVKLEKKNALSLTGNYDAIVTDLPYGKNSKLNHELNLLYSDFFKIAYKHSKILIVGLKEGDYFNLFYKWKIKNFFKIYIHKNMTKLIYVLTK